MWVIRHHYAAAFVGAITLALVVSFLSHQDYEQRIVQAIVEKEGLLAPTELPTATHEALTLVATYGRPALVPAQKYPASTQRVFAALGHTAELSRALELYGPSVVLIIAHAMQHDSWLQEMQATAGQAVSATWQSFKDRRLPKWDAFILQQLTPVQRGMLALLKILDEGHAFLVQWQIVHHDNGQTMVRRLPVRTAVQTITAIALGNVLALERKYVGDEHVGVSDVAWAAADVALVVAGGFVAKGVGHSGRTVPTGSMAATRSMRTVLRGTWTATKNVTHLSARLIPRSVLKWGTRAALVAGGAYMVWKYPGIVASGIKKIAAVAGIPGTIALLAVSLLFFAPLLHVLTWIIKLLVMARWFSRFMLRHVVMPFCRCGAALAPRVAQRLAALSA
jgi:hypothetical protein